MPSPTNFEGLPDIRGCTDHRPIAIEHQAVYTQDHQLAMFQATKLFCASCGKTERLDHMGKGQ